MTDGAGTPVVLRRGVPSDAEAIHTLALDAIRVSAAEHYTQAELSAWASRRSLELARAWLAETVLLVAEVAEAGGEVAGFATLVPASGELDQLFVAPRHGGRGVARALLTALEEHAAALGLAALDTRASWRARPVFERLGWQPVEVERVEIDGEVLTRTHMRKPLTRDAEPPAGG